MNVESISLGPKAAAGRAAPQWLCPICDSTQERARIAEVIWHEPMPGPKRYDIVRCRRCDIVAADPMPTRAVLDAYYSRYQPTIVDEFRATRLIDLQERLWRYLQAFMPAQGAPAVLDYGFGAGAFLKYVVKNTQARAFGVDFSPQNLEQLQRWCAQQNVTIGSLNVGRRSLTELGEDRFDLITLFQVIEHLVDPASVIRELASLQSRGGLLYIECPHQDAWFFRAKNRFRRLLSRQWMYGSVSPPQHVLGFNRKSLRALLERCGYRIVEIADYSVADGVHAPETVDWYPTPWEWTSQADKRTALGLGKAVIRVVDDPLSRLFGLGGGLFALAQRL